MGWKKIEKTLASGTFPKEKVLITRYPIEGKYPPIFIARLTNNGWKIAKGKLWFQPTHWQPLPLPPNNKLEVFIIRIKTWLGWVFRWFYTYRKTGESSLTKNLDSRGKVRLHPLPKGANEDLANVIGTAVAGAVRMSLYAHTPRLPNNTKGLLVGSIRKRAVNQLVCKEGEVRLRKSLGDRK